MGIVLQLVACAGNSAPAVSETPLPTPESSQEADDEGKGAVADGTYEAAASGMNGEVKVAVTFEGNKIVSVEVLEHEETAGIGDVAVARIPEQIVEHQSVAVDTIASATMTSKAIIEAVSDCIVAAGGDLEAFSAPVSADKEGETREYTADVVVVGLGLSGVTAAISAAENGASVIAVEKAAFAGGASLRASGGYMAVQVDENEEYHITDEEDHLDDLLARWKAMQDQGKTSSSIYPDYDRVAYMFTVSLEGLHWLQEHGIEFVPRFSIAERGVTVLTGDAPDMPGDRNQTRVFEKLFETIETLDITILYQTPATELVVDDTGAVIGVKASSQEGEVILYAKKTILACGSYADNPEMVAELVTGIEDCFSTAVTNTGDGIRMAVDIGAVLYEDQFPMGGASVKIKQDNPDAAVFESGLTARLFVNAKGERFMNEGGYASKQLIDLSVDKELPHWALFNALDEEAAAIAETGLASGSVIRGETLEDLADQAGMDPDVLEDTVARYNALATNGADEDFGKDAAYLVPYSEEGPYYFLKVVPTITDIMGGVKTNYEYQVLYEDGSVIENLYAVGSMSNRPYWDKWYNSGSSLTTAAVSGQMAGAHAAEHMK